MRLLLVVLFSLFSLASFGQGTMYFVPVGPNGEKANNKDILGASTKAIAKMRQSLSAVAGVAGFTFAPSMVSTSRKQLNEELIRLRSTPNDIVVIYVSLRGLQMQDSNGEPSVRLSWEGNIELKPQDLFNQVCKSAKSVIILLDILYLPDSNDIVINGTSLSVKNIYKNKRNDALRRLFMGQPRVLLCASEQGKASSITSKGTVFSDALSLVLYKNLVSNKLKNWNGIKIEVAALYDPIAIESPKQGNCQVWTQWECQVNSSPCSFRAKGIASILGGHYTGELICDEPDGYGKFIDFYDGRTYEGNWSHGVKEGQGTMKMINGTKYVGEWRNDKFNGNGTLTKKSGEHLGGFIGEYIGEFKDGEENGFGTITYAGGYKYEGDWKNGQMNGKGVYTFPSGNKYVGEYIDGKMTGKGTMFFEDGSKYVGDWKDGKWHGYGAFYDTNGSTLYRGQFIYGELAK